MDPAGFYQDLPTLTTRRLTLRKLRKEDAPAYFSFASNSEVTRFLRWNTHASLEGTEEYLAGVLEAYCQGVDGPWGIELAEVGHLIGSVHLMQLDPYHRKADIGVVLHRAYWGKGIGSEALHRVLELCFHDLSLQRVQGLAIHGNTAACRMAEKCGMVYEGLLRRYALQKGQWRDFDLYSILPEEFDR